ncbi:terminase [Brevibacillus sp. SYP-B805]|uniref:XkdF-like putative serine protease domain-containing protein n=1 Tax=Brevibacillus sp. SYP-B805 TaxID=1578199 RepID=UPI0013EBDC70|nr:XkdF-like putative serine protease domain-containing protein [Brevibacillus sp. SYP-B805]NGQ95019.1 terminase [Brevibacillus sp. SYP-B805]
MPFELKDAKITHISLVDKGANGRPFAIIKEEGKEPVQKSIVIAKTDKAKQIVYGVVYEPDVVDAHGDFMTAEEIEKAAHAFMESQHTHNIDKQHDLEADEGYVVESYIAPIDMQLGDQEIKKGSWVAGVKVTNAETWAAIEKGEITGFSMWGIGKRVKVEGAPSDTGSESVEKGLLHAIKKVLQEFFPGTKLTPIEKAVQSFKSRIAARDIRDKWYDAQWAFTDTMWEILNAPEITDKAEAIGETIDEYKTVAVALAAQWPTEGEVIGKSEDFQERVEAVRKAGKVLSSANLQAVEDAIAALTALRDKAKPKEEDDVKAEDIEKAVSAALSPITKQLQDLQTEVAELKKAEGAGDGANNGGTDPAAEAVTQAVQKALEPIVKQVENLSADVQLMKNARAASQQPGDTTITKSNEPSYMRLFRGQ